MSGAKLVYSGSSTKFADNGSGRHLSPYTWAKASNTELICQFAKWFNLSFTIVYFYNVYGGREIRSGKYATVIGIFKRLILEGETSLPVTSPGSQERNFTHIADIINGILLSASRGKGDGFGIGSDESFSIIELCSLFGCSAVFQTATKGNRMTGEVLTDKVKDLGWSQKFFLKEYISNFLASIK